MESRVESLTSEQWRQVDALRDEWLAVGLDTAPADRRAAEATVTEMYRLCGHPAPRYVWLDSPGARLALWLLAGTRGAQLSGTLWDHLGARLGAEVRDQLRGRLGTHLGDQFRGRDRHRIRVQLQGRLRGRLKEQLRGRLGPRLAEQFRSRLRNQLRNQLQGGLWEQVRGRVWNQVWGQLMIDFPRQLREQFADELWNRLWDQLQGELRGSHSRSLWGQLEAYWIAQYDVGERLGLVDYDAESSRCLRLWANLARSAHWWWPYERVCVMSDRPAAIRRDGQGRLHCPDGPAVVYRDGSALVWAWHGTRVPRNLIERPWSLAEILAEPNTEIRRCAIEKIDWGRFVQEHGLRPVATAPDPGNAPYHLVLYDLPDQMAWLYRQPPRILLCVNGSEERDGTRRRYGLLVPATHTDPVAAAAELYDLPVKTYRRLEVRR